MINQRGLTLLELILAIVMTSAVLAGSGVLYLSFMRTASSANIDARLQNELIAVFRDVELYLRDTVASGGAVGTATEGLTSSPAFYRENENSVCFATYNTATPPKEIWYCFYYYKTSSVFMSRLDRWICDHPIPLTGWSSCVTTTLSDGILLPYAVQPASVTDADFNNCIDTMSEANCESKGIYPVFGLSADKKIVHISLRAQKKSALGGKKDIATAGITKSIYLREESSQGGEGAKKERKRVCDGDDAFHGDCDHADHRRDFSCHVAPSA